MMDQIWKWVKEHAKKDWIYGFPEKVRDTESGMNYVARNKSLLSNSWVMEAICGRFKGRNKLSITGAFFNVLKAINDRKMLIPLGESCTKDSQSEVIIW